MFVDEATDRCDFCSKVYPPSEGLFGYNGSNPSYSGKDICHECCKKEQVTNCSCCGLIQKLTDLNEEFYCTTCHVTH